MRLALIPAAVVAMLIAVACGGGDDGDEGAVRSEGGLGVALVAANARFGIDRSADEGGGPDAAPGADIQGEEGGRDALVAAGAQPQGPGEGLTVTGYGVATAEPDVAVVEFYFSGYSASPVDPGARGSAEPSAPEDTPAGITTQIGEADLQPVIDAIVALGVPREAIEVLAGSYYDYYGGTATLRVRLGEVERLGDVVDAAVAASASLTNISLSSTNVSFMVEDCGPLEQAAMAAAAGDAEQRADGLAAALGLSRGGITGAAAYAYSPYGGSSCSVGYIGPYPLGGVAYAEGQAAEVQVYANITVTYAIQ